MCGEESMSDAVIFIEESEKSNFESFTDFSMFFEIKGVTYRSEKNRETVRFNLNGTRYFIKRHSGVGWRETVKNLVQFKLPIFGAKTEWDAVKQLHDLGIPTVTVVGYGINGNNPITQESFVILRDIGENISLEKFTERWRSNPPNIILKRNLIYRLADISRQLHTNGLNHRDYYICHFLMGKPQGIESIDSSNPQLYLIDLHRMQKRDNTPERWVVKDIAGLYFSSMDAGLTLNDYFRFLKRYHDASLKDVFKCYTPFWTKVEKRAIKLYQKVWKKSPKIPFLADKST